MHDSSSDPVVSTPNKRAKGPDAASNSGDPVTDVYAAAVAEVVNEEIARRSLHLRLRRAASRLHHAVRALTGDTAAPRTPPALPATTVHAAPSVEAFDESSDAPSDANSNAVDAQPEAEPTPGMYGHTRVVRIPDILGFLSTLQKTGTLRIANQREGYVVRLERGSVVYARSETPPEGMLLGQILVQAGAIEAHLLAKFLEEHPTAADMLGNALLDAELITKEALRHAVTHQAQRIFNRAYAIDDAHFWFDESDEEGHSEHDVINVTRLLLESARSHDESRDRLMTVLGDPFENESAKGEDG